MRRRMRTGEPCSSIVELVRFIANKPALASGKRWDDLVRPAHFLCALAGVRVSMVTVGGENPTGCRFSLQFKKTHVTL